MPRSGPEVCVPLAICGSPPPSPSTVRGTAYRAIDCIYGVVCGPRCRSGSRIGGLTASLVLSRVATRVTLVERAERPSEVGAALALHRTAWRFWTASDCCPLWRLRVRGLTGWTSQRDGPEAADRRDACLGAGLDHAIAVRRTDLHRLLLEAVAGVASIDTRFGWTVVSADPSGGGDQLRRAQRPEPARSACGPTSSWGQTESIRPCAYGRVREPGVAGSSYVRAIVSGRASPWFEEHWTPLGSFGQAPLGGTWSTLGCSPCGRGCCAVSRRDLAAFRQEWRRVLPAAADLLRGCRLSTTSW